MWILALALALQEPAPEARDAGGAPAGATTATITDPVADAGADSADAEALRKRIRGMRMSLLTGGERVRAAEQEAITFYGSKQEIVEGRLDTVHAELTEKRASYDLALDRALSGDSPEARATAMDEASRLGAEIGALEREREDLGRKRDGLSELVAAVAGRERERERLVAQLETPADLGDGLGLPLPTIGLAPASDPGPAISPLENEALVADLLRRDPRRARRILFEADPLGYWTRFPLQPPADALAEALEFPLPDLPGRR